MKLIIKTYQVKDKRLLLPASGLIFWPKGILVFLKDQIEGEYIEKVEWPIQNR